MKTKFISLLFLVIFNVFSCNDSSPTKSNDEPANLQVEVTVSEDSRAISIVATAENIVDYEFDLGDGSDIISNTTGLLDYTYSDDGTYNIEVKAIGASGKFLREEKSVSIGLNTGLGPIDDTGYSTPTSYSGMTLIWSDEFDDTLLNEEDWNYEIGTGNNGWGNNELQYYQEDNTTLTEGYLVIAARRESISNSSYTSSRLTTENKFEFQYGRVDIRAKLPKGQGIWPALWMLGANFRQVGWPACGEIDIMELVGQNPDEVFGTLHWAGPDGNRQCTCGDSNSYYSLSNNTFNDQFHVFTLIWEADQIRWLVDDQQFYVIDITPENLSEFRNQFFFIFNVAVGGNLPGNPDSTTVFPQHMIVDYVRVFQDNQ